MFFPTKDSIMFNSKRGQKLLHKCEKEIAMVFSKHFAKIPKNTEEGEQLKHISVVYTAILAKVAYSLNEESKKANKQNRQIDKAIAGFVRHYIKSRNRIPTDSKIKDEIALINHFYHSHKSLFLECLEFLDYHDDLNMKAKTSYQDAKIDKRLRKITKENEAFFQVQCELYFTFLLDYISVYSLVRDYVKELFVDGDYKSGELTKEGRTQAFYFFEVCYEVFLDILRYRLKH